MKVRLTALEYLKERDKNKEYWKDRSLYENPVDEKQQKKDLENACPCCHMIRSQAEIENNTCNSCGN